MDLPKQVGSWTRPDAPRRITADTIFDYMDGGGELYVGYRFDHLDVYEYQAADASVGTVLVELYWMQTSDDAFGLLSTDWTGEAVAVGRRADSTAPPRTGAVPPHRALYGAGLLRLWSGNLFARVLASRETPAARDAVLAIGSALSVGGDSIPPGLLRAVPDSAAPPTPARSRPGTPLRIDRTCFFRSYLVLNSQYFLASHDILNLNTGVSAATAEYAPSQPGARPTRLILVRYASSTDAVTAAKTFTRAYLPDAAGTPGGTEGGVAATEHGLVAWSVQGPGLAIVLDARDTATARTLANHVASAIARPGAKRP